MRERLNIRNIAMVAATMVGAVACSAGRGDVIEACSDDWDNQPSGIIVGPDGVLSSRRDNITFDRLVEIANNDDYGKDRDAWTWFMGDPVDKRGELACYEDDALLLTSQGADVLNSYLENRANENNCDSLQDNPSYDDLVIDC